MSSRTLEFVLGLSMLFIGIAFTAIIGVRLGFLSIDINTIILSIAALLAVIAAIIIFYDAAKGE